MPIHDWTRVRAGTFHFFHQRWIASICDALNMGGLPSGYFAMIEQDAKGPIPDVLALKAHPIDPADPTGTAVAVAPPKVRTVSRAEPTSAYARRADRVTVYFEEGNLVSVIEIVSPGNKDSTNAMKAFVRKAGKLLRHGIHLMVVDLFPPSARDPNGIHPAVWDQFKPETFSLPSGEPLTAASYDAGPPAKVAYVEPLAVGRPLPEMPLFLAPERYVPCPLEATYRATWDVFPAALKGPLEAAG